MSRPHRSRTWLGVCLMLLLALASFAPAMADDAGETTFDRNAEREWTDVNGVKLTGRYSGVIRDEVLINAGGRVNRVRLSILSEADIAWLWGLHNQEGTLDQLPVEYREPPVVTDPQVPVEETPATAATADETSAPQGSAGAGETAQPAATTEGGQSSDRTWTIGGNSIQGKFSGVIGTEILINVNNRVQRFRLSELSDWDRAWLWDIYNALGKLEDLPVEFRERPANPQPPGTTAAPETANDPAADAMYAEDVFREWANPDGEPFTARFEGFRGGDYVSLHDGLRSQRWSIDNLSQEDVNWIRGYHAHHGIEDQLPERLRPRTPNAPGSAVANLNDSRTWTDRDGNTIQGSFSSVRDEEVSIFRGHGIGWQDVHLARLSRNDLIWLQGVLRAEGRMSELPLVYRDPPDEGASDAELARERRQHGNRRWERYNGEAFSGAFDRMSEGIVHIQEHEAGPREEFWNDLSDDDHAYLKQRLERETPAGFFPEQRDLVPSQEEQTAGMRVWTDREGNQIIGSFSRLTAGRTVAVFNTIAGEASYIYEYLSNDDQAIIQGVSQQSQQVAQSGTSGYNSGYGTPGTGYPGGAGGTSSYSSTPFPTDAAGINQPQYGAPQQHGQPIAANQPPAGYQSSGDAQSSTTPTGSLGNGGANPSAYEQGRAYGEMYGKYVAAIVGVVCLIWLIRKVSR